MFSVPRDLSGTKIENVQWQVAQSESIKTFSAVGYFFAREIHQALGVPVGIINSSWGGTRVEAWMRLEELAKHQMTREAVEELLALGGYEKLKSVNLRYNDSIKNRNAAFLGKAVVPLPQPNDTLGFQNLDLKDNGFAQVDLNRLQRRGVGEVIFGQGKTQEQILELLLYLSHHHGRALATRVPLAAGLWISEHLTRLHSTDETPKDQGESASADAPHWNPNPQRHWIYHQSARCFEVFSPTSQPSQKGKGTIAVVSAGTSDGPVADEVECVLRFLGHQVDRINDVGVAGLHRILNQLDRLQSAEVLVVCAGMEGALASVAAGLVDVPVIAVPTTTLSAPASRAARAAVGEAIPPSQIRRTDVFSSFRSSGSRSSAGGDSSAVSSV